MSFKPPADMTNGLCYETPSDGEVRVHIVRNGIAVDYFDCTEADLGFLAASMLNFAALRSRQRAEQPAKRTGEAYAGPVIPQSSVALVSNGDGPGQLVVLRTGRAEIGFQVSQIALAGLGRALLEASEPGAVKGAR
jgi:hypothetical protein